MELKLVEQLLEQYFEGTTTIAEEKQLKTYFSSNDVAPHLAKYQALFGYFETQKEIHFEQKLPLQPRKQRTVKWIGIAASFVVLLGLSTFYFYPTKSKNVELGTFENPEEAYVETQKALFMVAEQVNLGMNSVSHLKEYEKTKKSIFKN
jgi:hypothetical protein